MIQANTRTRLPGGIALVAELLLVAALCWAFSGRGGLSLAALVLLYGVFLLPALRHEPAPWTLEHLELVWLTIAGCILALLAQLVVPVPGLPWLVPVLLAWRRPPAPEPVGAKERPALGVAALALALLLGVGLLSHDYQANERHAAWLLSYTNALTEFPPQEPFYAGSKLVYHYFVNLLAAFVSGVTGSPLYDVLRVVLPLFLLIQFVKTFAALAHRLSGSSLLGVAAPATFLAVYGYDEVLYGWFQTANLNIAYRLPSLLLAGGLMLSVIASLRVPRRGAGSDLVLLALLLAVSGARANVLPLLLCGLLFAGALPLLLRVLRVEVPEDAPPAAWPRLASALPLAVSAFVLSYWAFYSGGVLGANIMPLRPLNDSPTRSIAREPSQVFELLRDILGSSPWAVLLFLILVVAVKQGAFTVLGLARLRRLLDLRSAPPTHLVLLGMWIAGFCVLGLFENATNEQWAFYFFAHIALTLFVCAQGAPFSRGEHALVAVLVALQLAYFAWSVWTDRPEEPLFQTQELTRDPEVLEVAEVLRQDGREVWLVNGGRKRLLEVPALVDTVSLWADPYILAQGEVESEERTRRRRMLEEGGCEELGALRREAPVPVLVLRRSGGGQADQACLDLLWEGETSVIYEVKPPTR